METMKPTDANNPPNKKKQKQRETNKENKPKEQQETQGNHGNEKQIREHNPRETKAESRDMENEKQGDRRLHPKSNKINQDKY